MSDISRRRAMLGGAAALVTAGALSIAALFQNLPDRAPELIVAGMGPSAQAVLWMLAASVVAICTLVLLAPAFVGQARQRSTRALLTVVVVAVTLAGLLATAVPNLGAMLDALVTRFYPLTSPDGRQFVVEERVILGAGSLALHQRMPSAVPLYEQVWFEFLDDTQPFQDDEYSIDWSQTFVTISFRDRRGWFSESIPIR